MPKLNTTWKPTNRRPNYLKKALINLKFSNYPYKSIQISGVKTAHAQWKKYVSSHPAEDAYQAYAIDYISWIFDMLVRDSESRSVSDFPYALDMALVEIKDLSTWL
jgi:hypothetical protein